MGEAFIVRRGGETYELPILNSSYPADVTIIESASASASFSVLIDTPGRPAEYTYQWYVNGVAVPDATNNSYTKTELTSAATYTVYCEVMNKAGIVASRVATLTVESSVPDFEYTGSSEILNAGDYNWQIRFLTSGTFTPLRDITIDVCLVGGGGGGGYGNSSSSKCGGGGGGYVTNAYGIVLSKGQEYEIVVGAGGERNTAGGASTAFTKSADGGYPGASGSTADGGAGGSGGGGSGYDAGSGYTGWGGNGGSNGSDGKQGLHDGDGSGGDGGKGSGKSTYAFGVTSGTEATLLAGGGGGGGLGSVSKYGHAALGGAGGGGNGADGGGTTTEATSGETNTGGGGGGGVAYTRGKAGGSGIVIIRNARG